MHHSETDIVASRFVAATRVTDESGELDDGKVRYVGIFHKGPNISAATECAVSGTAGEDLSGGGDAFGANRAEAVATVESQREPPRLSMRATRAIRRIKPRAQSGPWKRGGIRSFIGLAGGGLKGALDFHLQFSTDAAAFGVRDSIPNKRAG
jgi:hypothetical protein